ncbi:MAG: cysA 3 [Nitrososphaeraceae archaeon]|nr:cysA 3 [Nitrososphaeraceae archaeon]
MEYVHPEVLVDTQWVEDHLKDPKVRVAEVDYDPKANYKLGHAVGAVLFDWKEDINHPITRNIFSKQSCEDLLQRAGINNDTTLILYGDFNNWFAAFAFWILDS